MSSLARFPFSAVVGQGEARLALLLAAVDPGIGGVLLRGDKGSAKSTLARGLAGMLPGGAPFVELPLGATEDRVLGTLDLRAALTDGETVFRPGLLSLAHGGVLYVDEVNLLPDHLVDVLLDVAASGINRVERDGVSHSHPARFVLVGSMNPEEGELRPQLLDRFGLSVEIKSPTDPVQRAEVVRRRLTHDAGGKVGGSEGDIVLRARLAAAMPADLPDTVVDFACRLAVSVGAEGLRADLVLCRAAAAFAGWEGRSVATSGDVERVASVALGHRRRRRPFDPPILNPAELEKALQSARQSFSDAYRRPEPPPQPPVPGETTGADEGPGAAFGGPGTVDQPDWATWPATSPDVVTDADDPQLTDGDTGAPAATGEDAAQDPLAPTGLGDDDRVGDGPDLGADVEAAPGGDAAGPDDEADDESARDDGTTDDADDDSGGGDAAATADEADDAGGDDGEVAGNDSWPDDAGSSDPAAGEDGSPTGDSSPWGGAAAGTAPSGTWAGLSGSSFNRPPPPSPLDDLAEPLPPPPDPGEGTSTLGGEARYGTTTALAPERGRVIGDRVPGAGSMSGVALAATVRAAAQRRQADPGGPVVTVDDLREPVRTRTTGRTVIVAVDASGSMGTHRRVEAATGAVLGLLADAYLRRDRVAMVTFRSDDAEVVLPPTASVELARSRLAELPTGGVTPLAEGITAGLALARRAAADGWPPLFVLITDGRATGSRGALDKARAAAADVAAAEIQAVVVDAEDGATRLGLAAELAATMGARHLRLDEMSSARVETAVRDALR